MHIYISVGSVFFLVNGEIAVCSPDLVFKCLYLCHFDNKSLICNSYIYKLLQAQIDESH